MSTGNPDFYALDKKISKLKKRLRQSPLSAFTVGDLFKIKNLLEHQWSSLHVSSDTIPAMKEEIKKLRGYLDKVSK